MRILPYLRREQDKLNLGLFALGVCIGIFFGFWFGIIVAMARF